LTHLIETEYKNQLVAFLQVMTSKNQMIRYFFQANFSVLLQF